MEHHLLLCPGFSSLQLPNHDRLQNIEQYSTIHFVENPEAIATPAAVMRAQSALFQILSREEDSKIQKQLNCCLFWKNHFLQTAPRDGQIDHREIWQLKNRYVRQKTRKRQSIYTRASTSCLESRTKQMLLHLFRNPSTIF